MPKPSLRLRLPSAWGLGKREGDRVSRTRTICACIAVLVIALAVSLTAASPSADAARQREFVTRTLKLSADPIAMAMAPDGRAAYAIYPGKRLLAFDASTGAKTGLLATGPAPTSVAASRTSVVLVQGDPTQALVIDVGKGKGNVLAKVRARVPIGPGTGTVAIAPDGASAWVGHRDGIVVLALPTGSIARTIDLPGQARKILLDGSRAWVLSDTSMLSVIDAISGAVLARRDLGGAVSDIAVGQAGSPLYATIQSAGILQSLEPATLEPLEQAPAGSGPMAIVTPMAGDGLIVVGDKAPAYLGINPLRSIGRVSELGPATMAAASLGTRRAWIAGSGKAAWIVDLGIRPRVLVDLEPTKAGLQGYPAIAVLQERLRTALAGDVRIVGTGSMEYEGDTGTAPMRLEVIRSGSTTYRDDGQMVTYMSATEVCTRTSHASAANVPYTCRARSVDEPDLVEQFRLGMPWERSTAARPAYGSLAELSRTSEPISVSVFPLGGPVVGASSGTVTYRLTKDAFSILEEFGNGPYYAITTRISTPKEPLLQDLAGLPRVP